MKSFKMSNFRSLGTNPIIRQDLSVEAEKKNLGKNHLLIKGKMIWSYHLILELGAILTSLLWKRHWYLQELPWIMCSSRHTRSTVLLPRVRLCSTRRTTDRPLGSRPYFAPHCVLRNWRISSSSPDQFVRQCSNLGRHRRIPWSKHQCYI